MSRRSFLECSGMAAMGAGATLPVFAAIEPTPLARWLEGDAFTAFVHSRMQAAHVPGLSLAVIEQGRPAHTAGFGWASLEARRRMTADTLINIASVTKTITCTAVMQLVEQGRLELDQDVCKHVPLPVRNAAYAESPITVRQLLVHTSSIADGPAYERSYACGDPQTTLMSWLREYFSAGGAHHDPKQNFHDWAPGARYEYSNVAYGLLGLLVERISGMSYADYCIQHIFRPLGMVRSRFLLAGMDRDTHATPYSYVADGRTSEVRLQDPAWVASAGARELQVPHCLYSFATLSDGLARTTAAELARFLQACIGGGALDGQRILRTGTVAQILSPGRRQGLTWRWNPDQTWGHGGSDPGVSTRMAFRPADGRGVVVLTNAAEAGTEVAAICRRIFDWAPGA